MYIRVSKKYRNQYRNDASIGEKRKRVKVSLGNNSILNRPISYSSVGYKRIDLNGQSRSVGYCCTTDIAYIGQDCPILIAVIGQLGICIR